MKNPLTMCNNSTSIAECQDGQLWEEVYRIFAGFNVATFTKELDDVFDNLHDEELLKALKETRWTGRPGYPIEVMWRTLIASYVLDIPTIQGLIRTLHSNPFIAMRCGIKSDEEIPTRFAYYRFIKKLIGHRDLIEICMGKTVEALMKKRPGFGEIVAVDASEIPTYANRYVKAPSDSDARWGVKPDRCGSKKWWLGYKIHLIADVKYEIPLIPMVTPANTGDVTMLIPLLDRNMKIIQSFAPKFVLADKGYDSRENFRSIIEDFSAIPIIEMIKRKKPDDDWLDNADAIGTPYCDRNEPMVFWGYDKKRKALKYRCPYATGKGGCTSLEKCSKSKYGRVLRIKIARDYRRFCQVPRHTKRWKQFCNKRVSVERVFSHLKKDGDGRIVNHRMRGLDKIRLNCQLSVWTAQAKALSAT